MSFDWVLHSSGYFLDNALAYFHYVSCIFGKLATFLCTISESDRTVDLFLASENVWKAVGEGFLRSKHLRRPCLICLFQACRATLVVVVPTAKILEIYVRWAMIAAKR